MPSSHDLHPKQGARFVFIRHAEVEPPRYRVEVFLPGTRHIQTNLRWDEAGKPLVEPAIEHDAVLDQLLRLARVLKRTPKARLTRWRDLA